MRIPNLQYPISILLLLAAGLTQAGTRYWDGANTNDTNNGLTGTGLGGAGNWNTSEATWWPGSGANAAWVNGNNDTAVFWGTAGTVTLTAPITGGGLTFNTSGYALDSSANALTFGAATNTIALNNVAAASITGAVTSVADAAVNLTGGAYGGRPAGTLTLAGTSSGGWSGTTKVGNGMTLSLANANQALLNTTGITLNGGGSLALVNDTTTTNLNRVGDTAPITVNGGGGITYNNPNDATYTETLGPVTVNSGELTLNLPVGHTSSGNPQTLTLSNLIQATGATVYFATPNSGNGNYGIGNPTGGNWIKVTGFGGSATPAGQIIGPWVYADYYNAIKVFVAYDSIGRVIPATPTTANEDGWTSATTTYKTNGILNLTNSRTAMALYLNGNSTVDAGNYALKLNGILSVSTVSLTSSGTGYLTTTDHVTPQPTYLYLVAPATISLPITDNNGPVTVVKGGSAALTLTNSASTFSGGVVLNAGSLTLSGTTTNFSGGVTVNGGTLTIYSDANLGTSGGITFNGSASFSANGLTIGAGRTITLNNGAIVSMANSIVTFSGPVIGEGGFSLNGTTSGTVFTNPGNTFTGPLFLNTANNSSWTTTFASIGDAPGAGVISLGGAGGNATTFNWTGGAQTFAHRQIVLNATTGATTINSSGSGALTINTDLAISGNGSKTLTLGGTFTGSANTFAGRIGDSASGATALTKADACTWVLSGANTYSGATTLSAGTLVLSGANTCTNTTTLSAGATLVLGNASALGTGPLTISGGTLDSSVVNLTNTQNNVQNWNANFTFAGSQNLHLGAGAVTLSATRTITVSANTLTVGGAIGGAFGLTKAGAGTLILSGANTYSGVTTNNGGGTLVLDYSVQDNSKLSDTALLTLGGTSLGGTLTLKGGTHTEVVTNTTLSAGGTFLTRASGGTSKLRMNAITRQTGGTISFADATLADTDTTNTTAGILGGWATLGNDWAVSANGSAADTAITALASYTGALPLSGGTNTGNYTLSGSQAQTGGATGNTVRITNSGSGDTLDLGANNLTLTSVSATQLGGLLYVGGGDNNYTISGSSGRIVPSGSNQELIFNVNTGTLTVSALVATNGASSAVTKTGAGTLVLNNTNSYTGATYVNQGVLRLANSTAAGTTAGTLYVQNGAAVELAGGINIGAKPINPVVGSGPSSNGALRNVSGTNTYGGAIPLGAGGARINSDGGLLNLTGGITTAAGNNLTIGGSGNVTIGSAITGAGSLIKDGAGTLTLTGTNTYSGATTINAGTLAAVTGGSCSNSTVTVTGAGTLQIQVTDTTSQWACTNLVLNNGATVRYTFAVTPSTTLAPLNVLGSLTFSGTPVIQVDPSKVGAGRTYPLLVVGGTAPSALPTLQGVPGKLAWIGNTLSLTTSAGTVLFIE